MSAPTLVRDRAKCSETVALKGAVEPGTTTQVLFISSTGLRVFLDKRLVSVGEGGITVPRVIAKQKGLVP